MLYRRRCLVRGCGLVLAAALAALVLTSLPWYRDPYLDLPQPQRIVPKVTEAPTVKEAEMSPVAFIELQTQSNDSIDQVLIDHMYQYYLGGGFEEDADSHERPQAEEHTEPSRSPPVEKDTESYERLQIDKEGVSIERPQPANANERPPVDKEAWSYRRVQVDKDAQSTRAPQTVKRKKVPMRTKPPKEQDLIDHFPTFMVIGFGKAGTKALFEALKLHPSLSGPYKERRFFSSRYTSDLTAYLQSIPEPPPGGYTIEKSPDYILHPQTPGRIVAASNRLGVDPSKLKFVVVLRDPIDRAVSEYLEWSILRLQQRKKKPLPSFDKMVVLDGKINGKQPFLNASCYAYHISRWLKVFPREQLCFVDGDKFRTDPYSVVHRLERCMGLQPFFTVSNFIYVQERGFYCFQSSQNKFCMDRSKGRQHPQIPDDVIAMLKEYFRPWNDLLPAITGLKFFETTP